MKKHPLVDERSIRSMLRDSFYHRPLNQKQIKALYKLESNMHWRICVKGVFEIFKTLKKKRLYDHPRINCLR